MTTNVNDQAVQIPTPAEATPDVPPVAGAPVLDTRPPKLDLSPEALTRMAEEAGVEGLRGGEPDDGAAAEHDPSGPPIGAGTVVPDEAAQQAADAELEAAQERQSLITRDGESYVIGGKYRGATLEDAIAEQDKALRESAGAMLEARQKANQLEDQVRQGFDNANAQLLQAQAPADDPHATYLRDLTFENQLMNLAEYEPERAARDALKFGRGDVYDKIYSAWRGLGGEQQAKAEQMHAAVQRQYTEGVVQQRVQEGLGQIQQAQQQTVQQANQLKEGEQAVLQAFGEFYQELEASGVQFDREQLGQELLAKYDSDRQIDPGLYVGATTVPGHKLTLKNIYAGLPSTAQRIAQGSAQRVAQQVVQRATDNAIAAQGGGAMMGTGSLPGELSRGDAGTQDSYEEQGAAIMGGIMRRNRRLNATRNLNAK